MIEVPQINTEKCDQILSDQEEKILLQSISPLKISKQIKQLIRQINEEDFIRLIVIPTNISLRLPKNTYKGGSLLQILMISLLKKDILTLKFGSSKNIKKHNKADQINFKQNVQLHEKLKDYLLLNNKNKTFFIKRIDINFESQTSDMYELYSLHFVTCLLEVISKFNVVITELLITKNSRHTQMTEDYWQIFQRMSTVLTQIILMGQINTFHLNFQFLDIFLKQISSEKDKFQNLYTFHLKSDSVQSSTLIQTLKLFPKLCSLRLFVTQLLPCTKQALKKIILQIIPQYNPLIQSIKAPQLYLPQQITAVSLKELICKCPYLGQMALQRSENQKEKDQFFKMICNRRINIQHYMNIIKIMDKGEKYDYETILGVLDCCKQFIF